MAAGLTGRPCPLMTTVERSVRDRAPRAAGTGRLARGVLSDVDIAAATVADMAPAMSFFFGFATIVVAAGIAAPLTVIVAMIAIGRGRSAATAQWSPPSCPAPVTSLR